MYMYICICMCIQWLFPSLCLCQSLLNLFLYVWDLLTFFLTSLYSEFCTGDALWYWLFIFIFVSDMLGEILSVSVLRLAEDSPPFVGCVCVCVCVYPYIYIYMYITYMHAHRGRWSTGSSSAGNTWPGFCCCPVALDQGAKPQLNPELNLI